MKKILFVALALLATGTMYADKKCCKDKASCSKSASAKNSGHDETAGGKSCCKKGTASVEASAPEEMHACCKKSIAAGGKACCAKGKGEHAEAPVEQKNAPQPVRDDHK